MGVLGAGAPGTLTVTQAVTYTIHYGNFGNEVAQTSTLTLSLWSGLTVLSAQPAAGRTATSATFGGGVLGWELGNINVGDEGVIQVRVRVDAVPPEGSLVMATITSDGRDLVPGDNVAVELRRAALRAVFLPFIRR